MPTGRSASPSLRLILALAGGIGGLIALSHLYAAIAMKPLSWGPIVFGILGGGVLVPLILFAGRDKKPEPLPESWRSEIETMLRQEGLGQPTLTYGAKEPTSSYPRPMALGAQLMLSERVLREFSRPALLWSVRTDVLAQRWFVRRALPAFFVALALCFLSIAFVERWHLSGIWLVLPLAFFLASLAGWARYGYVLQLQADRRFTRSAEDRAAAEEALGYPYRVQRARSRGQKWLFPAAELRGRARHLGIDLDAEAQAASRA